MAASITAWIRQSEQKINQGESITLEDLGALEGLAKGKQQHLLYIWANLDRIDAGVISWNYFGPFDSEYGFDPKNESPYAHVKAAMADGWRVISFPTVEYPLDNAHNQLGFEFILERFYAPADGLDQTPHGKRQ
jgi:hypothetical protein